MTSFAQRNLAAYVCNHVFEDTRPILLVVHEEGDWMFLCGDSDHDLGDCRVVGVGHLVDRDPSLDVCADLPKGFEAERSAVGELWLRCRITDDSC